MDGGGGKNCEREGKRVCAYVRACERERERERNVQYSEHLDIVPGGRIDN